MFKIVKKAIDEWNPYKLLPDAPEDEFDPESKEIADKITADLSKTEISEIIASVFYKAFGEDEEFTVDSCMETAEKIWNSIHEEPS
jgi:hypothetical protein